MNQGSLALNFRGGDTWRVLGEVSELIVEFFCGVTCM